MRSAFSPADGMFRQGTGPGARRRLPELRPRRRHRSPRFISNFVNKEGELRGPRRASWSNTCFIGRA
jgi:hypothetical protein